MRALLVLMVVVGVVGCSTPGDAAYRAGQPEHAARLYQSEAGQGNADAAVRLGRLIEEEASLESAYGKPSIWYSRGCELGSAAACHNVGVAHEYGTLGLGLDMGSARAHYLRAAERGYLQSQYNLASLYANRHFSDDVEGLRWMLVARRQAQGCPSNEACQFVLRDPPGHYVKLRDRMSREEITRAEQAASSTAVTP